jgi:hypothetical protein
LLSGQTAIASRFVEATRGTVRKRVGVRVRDDGAVRPDADAQFGELAAETPRRLAKHAGLYAYWRSA